MNSVFNAVVRERWTDFQRFFSDAVSPFLGIILCKTCHIDLPVSMKTFHFHVFLSLAVISYDTVAFLNITVSVKFRLN